MGGEWVSSSLSGGPSAAAISRGEVPWFLYPTLAPTVWTAGWVLVPEGSGKQSWQVQSREWRPCGGSRASFVLPLYTLTSWPKVRRIELGQGYRAAPAARGIL